MSLLPIPSLLTGTWTTISILTVVCVYFTLTVNIVVRLFAMLGFSVIIVAPTVKDSYWFMLCQFFSHIKYNQSSDSCRIIQVKLHQGLLGFCASSHTNMCLAAWVAIRKHAVGVGRGWEPISFFTAELPWCTSSCVPCPSLVSSPTPP